jgi:geranylgeranyl reductase family protein
MDSNVIVVGAGPAGASAAIRLAQLGVQDIVLLDRSQFPRDKTCGSGLSPNAVRLADELGIGRPVRETGIPITSLKLVTRGGRSMVLSSSASAFILLRRTFDELLVERAQTLGVELRAGVRATQLVHDGIRVCGVSLADGSVLSARFVVCADGAHSIFSTDPRPKRSISTLMGWWDGAEFVPGQVELTFAPSVAPLYGWLFPEGDTRVNIGICLDRGRRDAPRRDLRGTFLRFVADHYGDRLRDAHQIGRLKGHPIAYTTWIAHNAAPGVLYAGESARVTHHATGEGISQAMQSGIYAGEAIADVVRGTASERTAWRTYTSRHRRRFTGGFVAGHVLRATVRTPALDGLAAVYNRPIVQRRMVRVLGSTMAGSSVRARE